MAGEVAQRFIFAGIAILAAGCASNQARAPTPERPTPVTRPTSAASVATATPRHRSGSHGPAAQPYADDPKLRLIYTTRIAECRYLKFSHWSLQRAIRTIRRETGQPWADAAELGCIAGYK